MKLPTHEELSRMSREQLLSLWGLVRAFRIKLMGMGPLPASAIEEMAKIVPDGLMGAIVEDNRKAKGIPAPSGLIPDDAGGSPAPIRGSGWQNPRAMELPAGVRWVDQLCDVQDAIDKAELRRKLGGGR
jgi:hypothetical protein